MIHVTLSSEHERLVQERIKRGEFENADALVAHALDSLIERETEEAEVREEIREKINRGVTQLARREDSTVSKSWPN